MKRSLITLLLLAGYLVPAIAAHIRGGEMFYKYKGTDAAGNSTYTVTLKLYIDCFQTSTGQLDPSVPFTVFQRSNNVQVLDVTAPMTREEFIRYDPLSNPCISNPPTDVCYRLRYYQTDITIPNTGAGYTIAFQRCCRIQDIQNMQSPSNNYGVTYSCEIPGSNVLKEAYANSSPIFNANDAIAICYGSPFTFDFSAQDQDAVSDSIVYQLCNAYNGGGTGGPGGGGSCFTCSSPNPAAPPPYASIPYRFPYSGGQPMGIQVSINSATGLLSGIAPVTQGQYVVTACAYEYRKGVLINIHRKDIHIRVSDCIPLKALLNPSYDYCDDFLVTFRNEQVNPTGSMYIWDYGDNTKKDTTNDIEGRVLHQFADTGAYKVKVIVILAGKCIDSTTTIAKVYPGFYPGFVVAGSCLLTPIQFIDTTKTKYGIVSAWRWNFGDGTTLADTSHIKTPSWKYSDTGFKKVQLIVQSDKGCIDTVYKDIPVKDKPVITLPFTDTLICSNASVQDTLTLHASGFGTFSWSPPVRILNANSADPVVFPTTTTTYYVQLNENGCVNTDSVQVRVVPFVSLDAGPDQTICLTDTVQLSPVTDGLKFTWSSSPLSPINDIHARQPLVSPLSTTTFTVLASVGKCNMTDALTIRTVPYPYSKASPDTVICYEDTAQLHATITGNRFFWTPADHLSDANSLDPLAFPLKSTVYKLFVYDNLGCPKPGIDEVLVTVRDKIFPFAGNDTSVVVGQPLQLNGRGSEFYEWLPPTYLNRNTISNPVAVLNDNMTYVMRTFTLEGCFGLDTINIKVFKTQPDIFVPNAFHPGGARNNVLRPIPVGISTLQYFRIYNRWGQMVFQTTDIGRGWDGTLGGKPQDTGTYVWMVQGQDFTGKTVVRKGTAVLIR